MSGKYALIIGNTEYIDPGLVQLTAPSKDTEDFTRILKDKDLCAFDEVRVLFNELSSSVIEAIDEFFDQKKPDDLLVLYFSGHGVRDELGALYLTARNTIRTRLRSTAVKSDYIRDAMNQSRSKRQVIILDCCNSGAFPQGTKAELGGTMGMISAFQGYGRYVLAASDEVQFAWEGNKIIGEADNSLFTHFLLKGLEGEADSDSDGRITVDELYDYAYEQISRVTPKQTPRKDASKQEGEIVLRQITRIEDIKPVALADDLVSEIEDLRPYVREAAVQKLEKLIKGKNIGLARSAMEALEKIVVDDNTTRRVAQMATQILESVRQAERKAAEERRAREEAERLAALKAEEERLAAEKAEAERLAREKAETDRLAKQKAEQERLDAEKAETERKAREEAERLLLEQKVEEEQKAKKEAKRLAALKAKEEERLSAEQWDEEDEKREALELVASRKAEREAKENVVGQKTSTPTKSLMLPIGISGVVIVAICILGYAALRILPGIFGGVITPSPIAAAPTESLVIEAPTLIPTAVATSVSTPILASKSDCSNPNDDVLHPGEYDTDITGVAFSPDGCLIASATWNVGVQIWNVETSSIITRIDYYDWTDYKNFAIPASVAFSPDGQTLAIGKIQNYNSADDLGKVGGISLYRVSDGTKLLDFKGEVTSARYSLTFSPDGEVVASLYTTSSAFFPPLNDWAIGFWQASDGTLLTTIPGHRIAYSSNGEFLASASGDNRISIWQVSNDIPSDLVKTLAAEFSIDNVAFLPDGKTLASSGKMGTVLWNISDGTIIRTLETNNGENFAFSPDGEKIAYSICKAECDMYQSDPSNFPIIILSVSDGTLLETFEGHTGMVFSLAFSPDGQTLASSGRDSIRLWNLTP